MNTRDKVDLLRLMLESLQNAIDYSGLMVIPCNEDDYKQTLAEILEAHADRLRPHQKRQIGFLSGKIQ